jgi:hypothetical protein
MSSGKQENGSEWWARIHGKDMEGKDGYLGVERTKRQVGVGLSFESFNRFSSIQHLNSINIKNPNSYNNISLNS